MFDIATAIAKVKSLKRASFDETLEIHVQHAAGNLSGSVVLPCGHGKDLKVVCFVEGNDIIQARQAGAVDVGSDDLADRIRNGTTKFDTVVAHPKMMRVVGRLGSLLKDKMPNPLHGSISTEIDQAVAEARFKRVVYKSDGKGTLNARFGKRSMSDRDLNDNLKVFLDHIEEKTDIIGASISATMGASVKLERI